MLRTDYKDDVFEGNRQYKITTTGSKSEIEEVTEMKQEGDVFGSSELNAICAEVNRHVHVTTITLSKSGWTGTAAPYTQTVNVEGVTADMEPLLVRALADGATEATQKAYDKAYNIIVAGTGSTADGKVTFKIYKKPEIDITVGLRGV